MEQFVDILNKMSPYLLLGFLFAGIMHAFIPGRFWAKYLSGNSFRSVLNAALFGIPLPLCSCGVIPTAMSLRKEGASKGACVSFLIATPQTGLDSIMATYGLLGLPFAVIRPIAALVTAMFGGLMAILSSTSDKSTVSESVQTPEIKHKRSFNQKCVEALKYGYVTMMQDIGKWLIVGLVVAALITIFIPTEWFAAFNGNTWASMLLVLCIAIPMYVCATGSIPIAVALMLKGLTPGAALVLLMAGPACNVASILVVRKVLGKKTLAVYLLSIVAGAVIFGSLIDYLYFNGIVDFMSNLQPSGHCSGCEDQSSWFSWLCSAGLCALLVNALFIKNQGIKNKKNKNMRVFSIEGMSCNHCRISAEKAILGLSGVTSATVDLQKKEAYVQGDVSDADVCAAIEDIGFSCKVK